MDRGLMGMCWTFWTMGAGFGETWWAGTEAFFFVERGGREGGNGGVEDG